MATIVREIPLAAAPDRVWAAVRDFGRVRDRLCPSVLTDSRLDGDARLVAFANGAIVRERLVSLDDAARRLAYAATGGMTAHHNASLQVFAAPGGGSRLVWTTDLLPDHLLPTIAALIDLGAADMQRALDGGGPR